jgi:hypothetical protein
MTCYFHPDRPAVGTCRGCGKSVCIECNKSTQSGFYCPQCVQNGVPFQASIASSPMAIVSLVLAVIGLPLTFCYGCGLVFSIAAVIVGLVARHDIAQSGGRTGGSGMALAGIIIGLATIGIVVLAGVCYVLFLLFTLIMAYFSDTSSYGILWDGIRSIV